MEIVSCFALKGHQTPSRGSSALLQRAEAYARERGMTVLRINVLAKNEVAGQLYRTLGFSDYRIQLLKRLG